MSPIILDFKNNYSNTQGCRDSIEWGGGRKVGKRRRNLLEWAEGAQERRTCWREGAWAEGTKMMLDDFEVSMQKATLEPEAAPGATAPAGAMPAPCNPAP